MTDEDGGHEIIKKELSIRVNQVISNNAGRLRIKFILNKLHMSEDGIHPALKAMVLPNRFIARFASDSEIHQVRSF